jgi:hypothetical protein
VALVLFLSLVLLEQPRLVGFGGGKTNSNNKSKNFMARI